MIEDGMESDLERLAERALEERREAQLYRERRVVEHLDSAHVRIEGRRYVNFSSNDYLGLSQHPLIRDAVAQAVRNHGTGSGASTLITGYSSTLESAEKALATWKGTEAAVLLPSGYQASHAAIQAIAGAAGSVNRKVRFLLDKLVHASLIDAVRGTEKPYRVFGHNDLEKLERLLVDREDPNQLQVVVTESIFSMDGDPADLRGLTALKRRHPFVLVVDEAHGSGVYGANGSGYAAELGLSADVDVFVVTLSKALGSIGGAICASRKFCETVVNFGRAYIYSTAVPPTMAAACEAAIAVMRNEPERQRRVRELAKRVRNELSGAGWSIPAGDSPIIPSVVGAEDLAMRLAEELKESGMIVSPVRPPTVARGSSRLRVTVSAAHSDEEVDQLVRALVDAKRKTPM
jgi:8-amino-7-oxononanoate synthase